MRQKLIRVSVALMSLGLSVLLGAAPPSPVADAAQAGDRDAVRSLLKQAADVNASQADGMTALHWAAMRNDASLAETLLYAGASVTASTRINSYTPLLLAAKNGNAAVMEPLIKAGADVNGRTSNGTTALMFAAAAGNADAVNVLIDRGADINVADPVRGLTAVMFAAASDRTPIVALLAKHGADLKATTKTVDLNAMGRNSAVFAGVLFGNPQAPSRPAEATKGGEPPKPGESRREPQGRPEEGRRATGGQAPSTGSGQASGGPGGGGREGRNPFAGTAGIDRQYQLNELVYAQGGMTPLLLAARQGYTETVRTLLDAGAGINEVSAGDSTSPILIATLNGHFDLAKELLDRHADPRLAAENGVTPLYAALNCEGAQKALYPQPRAYVNQKVTYLELMNALHDAGAGPKARLEKQGGEVPQRRAARRSEREGSRRQHGAAQRSCARRRRDDQISRLERRRRDGGQPRREDDGRHGERSGAAHPALARSACAPRIARREEQPQVRLVLT